MKILSTKTIVSRTIELTKHVKTKNISRRNVSISGTEKCAIGIHDVIYLTVFDSDENVIGAATYTGHQFHERLVGREKWSWGKIINFYTLPY